MTKEEFKEHLKAKFTDELSENFENSNGVFFKTWRVSYETEKEIIDFDDCEDIYEDELDQELELLIEEGLINLWIQPPAVKVFDKEEKETK